MKIFFPLITVALISFIVFCFGWVFTGWVLIPILLYEFTGWSGIMSFFVGEIIWLLGLGAIIAMIEGEL